MLPCFLALTDADVIRAFIVYQSQAGVICGCYMGYAGGGITDFRFFSIDKYGELLITDDEQELSPKCLTISDSLIQHRNQFIDWDASTDGNISSVFARSFVSDGSGYSRGIRHKYTENFELDVLRRLQDQWSLTYVFDN